MTKKRRKLKKCGHSKWMADLPRINFCHANFFWIFGFHRFSHTCRKVLSLEICIKMRIGARTYTGNIKWAKKSRAHFMTCPHSHTLPHTHTQKHTHGFAHTLASRLTAILYGIYIYMVVWTELIFFCCARRDLHTDTLPLGIIKIERNANVCFHQFRITHITNLMFRITDSASHKHN